MPRPRTPSKILDARGAFKKNPQRKRDGEPEVKSPLGAPPEHLNESEAGCWHEIVSYAAMGVLTQADRLSVEIAARLLAESRVGFIEMPTARLSRLHVMLGQFGMTPSERSKLNIERPRDANPFTAFDE